MLERATTEQAFLKIGMYGGPGAGKTFTALKCATALGRTALLDTERGSDFYAADFSFDVFHTKEISRASEVLREAVDQKYDCLIVDQITHYWESAQEEYIAGEHEKMSKAWAAIEKNQQIPFQGWRFIKRPYKRFIHELISAPIHVFMLGRLAIEYEVSGSGEPKKVGERMDAEKATPYEPHVLIKMEFMRKTKKWMAYIEKDRSGTIQGELFTNPGIEMLEPVLAKLGKVHKGVPEGKEDTAEGTFGTRDDAEPSQLKLIRVLAKKGGIDNEVVEEKLKSLTRPAAAVLVNDMTVGNNKFFE